ncbi:hypothetical protein T484DRAFT_1916128, partial [Baffinella frigidus]
MGWDLAAEPPRSRRPDAAEGRRKLWSRCAVAAGALALFLFGCLSSLSSGGSESPEDVLRARGDAGLLFSIRQAQRDLSQLRRNNPGSNAHSSGGSGGGGANGGAHQGGGGDGVLNSYFDALPTAASGGRSNP